jgi:hypothetical protein
MMRRGVQAAFPLDDLWALSAKPLSRPEILHQLAEAGLELRQAPEGFCAIRLKQAAVPAPAKPTRRVRRTR